MKSYDEKWEASLHSHDDGGKRYKALLSIKKACKDSGEDLPKYKKVINEYILDFFDVASEKFLK